MIKAKAPGSLAALCAPASTGALRALSVIDRPNDHLHPTPRLSMKELQHDQALGVSDPPHPRPRQPLPANRFPTWDPPRSRSRPRMAGSRHYTSSRRNRWANRLELTTWDVAREDQRSEVAGLPYVRVVDRPGRSSPVPGWRHIGWTSAYVMDGSVNGVTGREFLPGVLGLAKDQAVDHRDLARAICALDPVKSR